MIEENDMTRVIEEIARVSLGMVFDEIGHELDLSDAKLLKVRDHLEDKLNAEEAYLDCPQYTFMQKLEALLEATRQKIADQGRIVDDRLLEKERMLEQALADAHSGERNEFVFNPKIQQELLAEYKD